MGAWGDGLLENDEDLDCACEIDDDAGISLQCDNWDEEGTEKSTKLEATRAQLNEGIFDRLFNKYKAAVVAAVAAGADPKEGWMGSKRYPVILITLAMGLGANVSEEQKIYVKTIHRSAGLFEVAIAQFEQALKDYESGKPYDFNTRGLGEVIAKRKEDNAKLPENEQKKGLVNHFGLQYYEDGVGTHNLTGEKVPREAPAKDEEPPPGDDVEGRK